MMLPEPPKDLLFRKLEPLRALKGLSFGYLGGLGLGASLAQKTSILQTMVAEFSKSWALNQKVGTSCLCSLWDP